MPAVGLVLVMIGVWVIARTVSGNLAATITRSSHV